MGLSHQRLLNLLKYDPSTGRFIRLTSVGGSKEGDVAGSCHREGYVEISVGGFRYLAHRLAVFYMTGVEVPIDFDVDHIDRDRANNQWSNLRVVSRSVNLQNQSVNGRPSNRQGMLGVSFHRASGLWRARVISPMTKKEIVSYHQTREGAQEKAIQLRRQTYEGFVGEKPQAV